MDGEMGGWIELQWMDIGGICWDGRMLGWITGVDWIGLDWIGLSWDGIGIGIGLGWVGWDRIGLVGLVGSDWVQPLDWIGLHWIP